MAVENGQRLNFQTDPQEAKKFEKQAGAELGQAQAKLELG